MPKKNKYKSYNIPGAKFDRLTSFSEEKQNNLDFPLLFSYVPKYRFTYDYGCPIKLGMNQKDPGMISHYHYQCFMQFQVPFQHGSRAVCIEMVRACSSSGNTSTTTSLTAWPWSSASTLVNFMLCSDFS